MIRVDAVVRVVRRQQGFGDRALCWVGEVDIEDREGLHAPLDECQYAIALRRIHDLQSRR